MENAFKYLSLSFAVTDYYPTDRPYSIIEATLYLQQLYYYTTPTAYNRLAKLWQWKYHKVLRLFKDYSIKLNYQQVDHNGRNKQGYICKAESSASTLFVFHNEYSATQKEDQKGITSYKSISIVKDPSDLLSEDVNENINKERRHLILQLHNLGCTNAILGDLGFSLKEKELQFLVTRLKYWKKNVKQKGKTFHIIGALKHIVKTEIEKEYSKEAGMINDIVVQQKDENAKKVLSFEQFSQLIKDSIVQYTEHSLLLAYLKTEYPEVAKALERFPLICESIQHTPSQLKTIYTHKYLSSFNIDE